MKILVTGGTGLVGKAIESISKNYNYDYIFLSSKDCDLCDYNSTYNLFAREKPDYVIHLAANVGGLFKNMKYKVDMLEKNLMINYNVIKCSHEFKVKKLISCLSTCIFPDKTLYPVSENMLHDGPPHCSNDAYAYAKRMIEIHSRAYQEQYDDNFICVIPTNIYGPHDNYNLEDAHVIPALIHKCYLAKQNNEKFIVKGTGKPLRQFIYSEDLAKLMMWTLENYNVGNSVVEVARNCEEISENFTQNSRHDGGSLILSVGEKDEVSIEDVAREIARNFDYEDMLVFDTSFSDGQYKKTADNTKLINLIGDYKFIGVKEGIKKSVEWFVENYYVCRK